MDPSAAQSVIRSWAGTPSSDLGSNGTCGTCPAAIRSRPFRHLRLGMARMPRSFGKYRIADLPRGPQSQFITSADLEVHPCIHGSYRPSMNPSMLSSLCESSCVPIHLIYSLIRSSSISITYFICDQSNPPNLFNVHRCASFLLFYSNPKNRIEPYEHLSMHLSLFFSLPLPLPLSLCIDLLFYLSLLI